MPSYLYPEQNIPIQPYNAPLELYSKALQLKDARFKEGLSNLRNKYDSILNTDLTNTANSEKLRTGVESVMKKLSKVVVNDVSLPENQSQIDSLFDNIIKDKDLIYDAAWTRNHRNELAKAESLSKSKPDLVKPQNLHQLYKTQEMYRNSEPGVRPGFTKFTAYDDYNTRYNTELDKIKQDVNLNIIKGRGLTVTGPDGTVYNLDDNNVTQQQIKEIKDWKIKQLLWERLNQDPAALNQMRMDHEYNKDSGFYSPDSAIADIDQYVDFFTKRNKIYNERIGSGILNEIDLENYTNDIKTGNQRIKELSDLKTAIQADPSRASDYFTFNKFVKDYVDSKSKQYSNREDGLILDVPGYKGALDTRLNMLEKEYEDRRTSSKSSREAEDKLKLAYDMTEVPYQDLMEQLADGGPIQKPDDFIQGLLGLDKDKDNNLTYGMAYSKTQVPGSMVIIQPADSKLTTEQTENINVGGILSAMKSDLNSLGITRYVDKPIYTKDGEPTGVTSPASVRAGYDYLIKEYNLLSKEEKQKVDKIFEKYKPALSEFNLDPSKYDQIREAEVKLTDSEIDDAVQSGIELNTKLAGKFTFIPDRDFNVQQGQSGKMYSSGYMLVGASTLERADVPYKKLIKRGLAKFGPIIRTDNNQKGKAVEVAEQGVLIHVNIPVNGDIYDINDRILQTTGFAKGTDQDEYRTRSKNKLKDFSDNVLSRYSQFNRDINTLPLTVDPIGRSMSTSSSNQAYNDIMNLARDMSAQTGKPVNEVYNELVNTVKAQPNPIKSYRNFESIKNQIGGQSVINKFKQAISGNESGGSYYSGARPGEKFNKLGSTASGRYGLIESAFYGAKKLEGFPEKFQGATFEEYKVNPELQEAAATALMLDLYKKYKDPIVMAVAWFTGENSQETKDFIKDPSAAYQKYKNSKPSTGQGNINMNVGDYVDKFIKTFGK